MARRSENLLTDALIFGGAAFLAYQYVWPVIRATPATVARGADVVVDTVRDLSAPRGVRNNNPGNIEFSILNAWRGQKGSDGRFAIFDAPVYGVRAMIKLLTRYIRERGLDTIAKIGSRWAPKAEAGNRAWVSNVAINSGIGQNVRINPADFGQMSALVKGIIAAENGPSYVSRFANVISQAWAMK